MSIIDELKSGNGTVYAQWSGLLSIVLLIVGALNNLFTKNIVFGIVALVEAFVMILLELPIFQKCCPTGPTVQAFITYFEGNKLRAMLYLGFSIVMWLHLLIESSILLILAALTMLFAAVCYAFAAAKNQERQPSALTGANIGTMDPH